jgi:hypothetical protein
MKIVLIMILCLFMTANLAYAQIAGQIVIAADPNGISCDIYDTAPGAIQVYVLHMFTPGASGCQFSVNDSEIASNWVYLSELVTAPYLSIGNARGGMAITYGGCVSSPNLVLTMTYLGSGTANSCSFLLIEEDPSAAPPGIYVVDCAYPVPNLLTGTGGTAVVNPDGSCNCNVPAEDASWGRIKHLYR